MNGRPITLEPDLILGGVLGLFGFIAVLLGDTVESKSTALMWVMYVLAFVIWIPALYFIYRGWGKR
jgi:hypothetical protein